MYNYNNKKDSGVYRVNVSRGGWYEEEIPYFFSMVLDEL